MSLSTQAVTFYDTVFQAVAGAAENQKKNLDTVVLILIDSLGRQEMEVFQTLASLSLVNTWALSSLNQPEQKKFRRAMADGATGWAVLHDTCPERVRLIDSLRDEPNVDQELTPEPPKVIEESTPALVVEQPQPVQKRQPPPAGRLRHAMPP